MKQNPRCPIDYGSQPPTYLCDRGRYAGNAVYANAVIAYFYIYHYKQLIQVPECYQNCTKLVIFLFKFVLGYNQMYWKYSLPSSASSFQILPILLLLFIALII